MNQVVDRIGEVRRANNGMLMKIIAYRNSQDIDIEFEDGFVVYNRTYHSFKVGEVANPNVKRKKPVLESNKRLGLSAKMNNGLIATIIAYRNSADIDIQFEDGVKVYNKTYSCFTRGQIGHPNKTTIKSNHLGEEKISNSGMKMKIIRYGNCRDIDVEFENGEVVKNRAYGDFVKGTIALPKEDRTGMVVVSMCGLRMKIIGYNGCNDVTVLFEDGKVLKNAMYKYFKVGKIRHPLFTHFGNCSKFYDYKDLVRSFQSNDKVFYFCKTKDGAGDLLTPQQMMKKSGIKAVF